MVLPIAATILCLAIILHLMYCDRIMLSKYEFHTGETVLLI